MSISVIGIGHQFAHHYQVRGADWSIDIIEPPDLSKNLRPDVAILANEVFPEYRNCIPYFQKRGIPTIYAIDGILEWRHSWDFPPSDACGQTFRPVLADKIACIGRSQARILESWGNVGKCEVVGVPRFDNLVQSKSPRMPSVDGEFRVLVMTAKNPGFDEAQRERTRQSLVDLNEWFQANPEIDGRTVCPVWRLTVGMDQEIGVDGSATDTTGKQLAELLPEVDAVITTPSTAMLESMRIGLPVALLDYHNCPHYVPAAWTISAASHLDTIVPELASPAETKMLWQDSILHDALACDLYATPRYVELVEEMARIGQECRAKNLPLQYPARILSDPAAGFQRVESRFDLAKLFPTEESFQEQDLRVLQVAVSHLNRQIKYRDDEIERLKNVIQPPPEEAPPPSKDNSLRGRLKRLHDKVQRKIRLFTGSEAA
ncbi:hypothetical protein GC197_04095 [bacterium]|nr:hypothetical protein [bacterium]